MNGAVGSLLVGLTTLAAISPGAIPSVSSIVILGDRTEGGSDQAGSVTFLAATTLDRLGSMTAGDNPRWAGYSPDGQQPVVLNGVKGEGVLGVIDTAPRILSRFPSPAMIVLPPVLDPPVHLDQGSPR